MTRLTYKDKSDENGYLVLMYENCIKGEPRKLETTWLGLYVVETSTSVQKMNSFCINKGPMRVTNTLLTKT